MCWPPREKQQRLSEVLTIYGFWIGLFLAVVAILLFFDIFKMAVVAEPREEGPFVSDVKVKIEWEADYDPPEQIEESLREMLMGKLYKQSVVDYEVFEFVFPQSVDDFPDKPQPTPPQQLIFLKWRIGSVPRLPSNENPLGMRLPLSGDAWEWNIPNDVMQYIQHSEGEAATETAWYKIAIAMIGGHSRLFHQGPSVDQRIAAIDGFKGASWTFEATYKVWNSGNTRTGLAKIICDPEIIDIESPSGVDYREFIIEPGIDNALEFKITPKNSLTTLDAAQEVPDSILKGIKLDAPVPEPEFITKGSALIWILGALGSGVLAATLMMILSGLRYYLGQQKSREK